MYAFLTRLLPALNNYQPELLIVSAGFDSRSGDPLGQLLLTDKDFADLTDLLLEFATRACEGRLVSVLEGGYNLAGLGKAVASHVARLVG